MRAIILYIAIFSSYQVSVHGQRQQNPVNYEYVYYDYYDDYYDYGGQSAPRHTAIRQQAPTKARRPASGQLETQQQKPAVTEDVDEDVGELPEYDLKEIVDAWKEYVKEKEKKNKEEAAAEESFDYDLTGPRRPGGLRFQATGPRQTGPRGTGPRQTGLRGTGPRQTGFRGTGTRQTGLRGPGPRQTGFRGTGPRQTGFRGSGPRQTGFRGTGPRQTGPRGTGIRGGFRQTGIRGRPAASGTRGGGAFLAYEDEYPQVDEVPVRNNRFNVEDLLSGLTGGGGVGGISVQGSNSNRFENQGYQCEPLPDASYSTPDKKQCDKYYECNIKGEEKEKLCDDGLVYDIASQHCDYPAKVNCSGRPDLQEAQVSKNCPRANGFFAFPAEESCQKFWDCRGGKSYLQECPVGVIFDPKVDACVTPDQAARPECAAGKVLGFECPAYEKDEVLRFGNHDRLPSPKNCQEFFTCLRKGQPRLGVCPKKTVFNSESGNCDKPENVKGCETYWKEKEAEELADYYDY